MIVVDFLYWLDCPSHEEAYERLCEVLAEVGKPRRVRRVRVTTEEQAALLEFPGSPTIKIDGRDIQPEALDKFSPGLTCRLYILEDGRPSPLPSREMIHAAVQAALAAKSSRANARRPKKTGKR